MRLSVLDEFECIGEKCPQHCCGEWQIEVDENVLVRWQLLPDDVNKKLLQHVNKLDDGSSTHTVLSKKDDGSCWLLDESGLCSLQNQHGHDALPDGCQDFPRKQIRAGGVTIETALLSCPEIARKVILNAERKPLFENLFDVDEALWLTYSAKDRIFLTLYKYTSQVLSIDKFSLSLKLALIGKTVGELVDKCERVNYDADQINSILNTLTKKPKNQLNDINIQIKGKKPYNDPIRFLQFWKSIVGIFNAQKINLDHLSFTQSRLYNFLQDEEDANVETSCDFIIQKFINLRELLHGQYDDVFARYAELTFVNRGFPLSPYADNQILAFSSSVVSFSLFSLALAAAVDDNLPIDTELISETVWRIERKLGHENSVYDFLIENEELMDPLDYYRYLYSIYL